MDTEVTFVSIQKPRPRWKPFATKLAWPHPTHSTFLPRRLSVQRGYHSRLIFAHRLRQFRESKHWLMSGRPSVTLTRTTRGCWNNFFACYRAKGTWDGWRKPMCYTARTNPPAQFLLVEKTKGRSYASKNQELVFFRRCFHGSFSRGFQNAVQKLAPIHSKDKYRYCTGVPICQLSACGGCCIA